MVALTSVPRPFCLFPALLRRCVRRRVPRCVSLSELPFPARPENEHRTSSIRRTFCVRGPGWHVLAFEGRRRTFTPKRRMRDRTRQEGMQHEAEALASRRRRALGGRGRGAGDRAGGPGGDGGPDRRR